MALPFARDASAVPMHVLFPDDYRESARMIVKDFAFFGASIVVFVVGMVVVYG